MKNRILHFIEALRAGGLQASLAESLDALAAVAVAGVEMERLREALAATLVKDEANRHIFDVAFERYFAVPRRSKLPQQRRADTGGAGAAGPAESGGSGHAQPTPHDGASQSPPRSPDDAGENARTADSDGGESSAPTMRLRLAHAEQLAQQPFGAMDAAAQEQCRILAEELARRFRAHLSRRVHARKRGRLDIRRTLRRAIATGGIPIDPAYRRRRRKRLDLVVLCDHSYSVTTASHFLLSLLAPCGAHFRRVALFAFVDRPVEVSLSNGHLVPHTPLDLYAHSDFGRTLAEFSQTWGHLLGRNTLLIILGDARNNRRPARADILARMASAVREVVWLNPEPQARWDSGDSVMRRYVPHCGIFLAASTPRSLAQALRQALVRYA